MKQDTNEMELIFDSCSENEGFARVAVAAFLTQLNPTLEEVADVKTAVSEAVTNAVIHGYDQEIHKIRIRCRISGHAMEIEIRDEGNGIEDVEKAMQPMFTTRPELDRSGMGFAFMEAFMDELEVESEPGKGTTVRMKKKIGSGRDVRRTREIRRQGHGWWKKMWDLSGVLSGVTAEEGRRPRISFRSEASAY